MEYKIFKEKRGVEPLRGLSQQLAIAHTYRCITLPKFKLALIIILFVKSFRILKTEGGQRRMGGG